jgi:hypothetical protein
MNEELLEREKRAWAEVGAVADARAEVVRKTVQDKFPDWLVTVRGSSESGTFCVDVFNVPDEETRDRIEDFIYALYDDKDVVGTFFLLAMVKDVEVTKKYYPQYADKKGDGACLPPA